MTLALSETGRIDSYRNGQCRSSDLEAVRNGSTPTARPASKLWYGGPPLSQSPFEACGAFYQLVKIGRARRHALFWITRRPSHWSEILRLVNFCGRAPAAAMRGKLMKTYWKAALLAARMERRRRAPRPDAAPAAEDSVEEMVITARRTEENLQTVPAAVSGLLREGDRAAASHRLRPACKASVPNLKHRQGRGSSNATNIYIRASASPTRCRLRPAVGVYVGRRLLQRSGARSSTCSTWSASRCCAAARHALWQKHHRRGDEVQPQAQPGRPRRIQAVSALRPARTQGRRLGR